MAPILPAFLLLLLACGCLLGVARAADAPDAKKQREDMVRRQLLPRGIGHPDVLRAMRTVPREEFVPEKIRHLAYDDRPLPIGWEQTISQPYIVAFMTEALAPGPEDRVLEIGTGSGYQAAVLSMLVKEVCSIEIVEPLAWRAEKTLARLGYASVRTRAGDGYQGWAEASPFDAIIVTCAPDHVPAPLVAQLKEGGRMIIPVGEEGAVQELVLLRKKKGRVRRQSVMDVRFVPMTGTQPRQGEN
ncbi:protein-L-isoaspartate(D-aspartate) O-methyltransferase [Termitidicoccus mucosus]|uniref:Protein-L-isoaspartate O-methyltransferase n=1 Tax=Termitidicoccus mucosus TaxID=1184151 RepID=A0A178IGQ1_9BACT|nr:protein-L-isoaspartate O-methyltransferase [Opitutaceae bacterium TSB47]